VNKFKLERKTIKAAQLRRMRDRVQASIAQMDPTAWQHLIDRLGGEEVTETFVFGEDGSK